MQQGRNRIGARRKGPPRRGSLAPPKRKKKQHHTVAVPLPESAGFETLARFPGTTVFADILESAPRQPLDLDRPDRPPHRVTPREAFLFSVILHLTITFILLVKPDLIPFTGDESETAAPPDQPLRDRMVMLLEPPKPPKPPPTPPPEPAIIPRATQPAPPEEKQQDRNFLPFSKGNTDEFVPDKEEKKSGEPGEGEKAKQESPEPQRRVADLLPERFSYYGPLRRPRDIPPPPPVDPGKSGEDGPFENIRRFLLDKQFHNPEGGLISQHNKALYYNDKGANFVPWIRRLSHEVGKHWRAGMPFSAYYERGHVAVGVSFDRAGNIADLQVLVSSSVPGFDNAAVGALRAAQLLPVPSDYPDSRFDLIAVFFYNEEPYDIFR